jgi:hypothetical protein
MVEVDRDQCTEKTSTGWDPYEVWAARVRQAFPKLLHGEETNELSVQPQKAAVLLER